MAITKLSKQEWAFFIEKGLRRHIHRQKYNPDSFWQFINQNRIVPLTLGIVACTTVIYIWGWKELLHMLLSWTIGIIVVTTLVAGVLHPGHPNSQRKR